jgi:hypothetical protein
VAARRPHACCRCDWAKICGDKCCRRTVLQQFNTPTNLSRCLWPREPIGHAANRIARPDGIQVSKN